MANIILSSNIESEIGLASMYCSFSLNSECLIFGDNISNDFERITDSISNKTKNIIIIGNYWSVLFQLLENFHKINFYLYCFDDPPKFSSHNLSVTLMSPRNTPCQFIISMIEKTNRKKMNNIASKFGQYMFFNKICKQIDNRLLNTDLDNAFIFYAGLENYIEGDSLFTKFRNLFSKDYKEILELLKVGKIMNQSFEKLVKSRILNSKIVTLIDSTQAAVTCSTDLIDLTHKYLYEMYPTVQLTIICQVIYENGCGTKFSYSFKSHDDNVSVLNIAKEYGADFNTNRYHKDQLVVIVMDRNIFS